MVVQWTSSLTLAHGNIWVIRYVQPNAILLSYGPKEPKDPKTSSIQYSQLLLEMLFANYWYLFYLSCFEVCLSEDLSLLTFVPQPSISPFIALIYSASLPSWLHSQNNLFVLSLKDKGKRKVRAHTHTHWTID